MIEIHSLSEVFDSVRDMDAVIFDLDDTLYSEKEYVRSGFHEAAKLLAMIPDAEQKLWRAFEDHRHAIDAVLEDEGICSEELKQQCLAAYRQQEKPEIHLYEGAAKLLSALRNDGKKLGIITDGRPEGQHSKIRALNLDTFVDEIIVTDELGGILFRKPCEKAYRLMSKKLSLPFRQMAYVGDNRTKDFIAPEKLRMKSIWFHNPDGLYF